MTDSTLTRKERDRRLREEDFLNAAEKLFSERGFHDTSMEDVASEAQYATGTIYRYFASKMDLYQHLLIRRGRIYFHETHALIEQATGPVEKLRAAIRGKVDFFFAHREFLKIYCSEIAGQSGCSGPPQELQQEVEQSRAQLRNILATGMEQGLFRELNVETTLAAFIGLTHQTLQSAVVEDSTATADDIEAFVFGFIMRALQPAQGETSS